MTLLMNSTKYLKKNQCQFFIKSSKNTEEAGIPPNSFYEASNILTPNPKTSQEKKTTDQYHL